jgi:hypothetical protein
MSELAERTTLTEDVLAEHVRMPTKDEAEFYEEYGWVRTPELFSAELTALILDHVQSAAGYVEGEGFTNAWTDLDKRGERRTAWYSTNMRDADEVLRSIAESRTLGEMHARILGERPLRLWSDSTNTKPPGAVATGWHQDMQAFPWDRPSGGGVWVPLVEMTPDMAPLQHLNGSHREPWIEPDHSDPSKLFQSGTQIPLSEVMEKYPIAPAQHLQAGDGLFHHALTFHGTERGNETDRIRWAWISQRFPADVSYIAKHNTRSNDLGLEVGKPLDHPTFPIVLD